jgi:hypothetical protein
LNCTINSGLGRVVLRQSGAKKRFGDHGQCGLSDDCTDSKIGDNQDLVMNPEGRNKAQELRHKTPEDEPNYLLFNLENDKEE